MEAKSYSIDELVISTLVYSSRYIDANILDLNSAKHDFEEIFRIVYKKL